MPFVGRIDIDYVSEDSSGSGFGSEKGGSLLRRGSGNGRILSLVG